MESVVSVSSSLMDLHRKNDDDDDNDDGDNQSLKNNNKKQWLPSPLERARKNLAFWKEDGQDVMRNIMEQSIMQQAQ